MRYGALISNYAHNNLLYIITLQMPRVNLGWAKPPLTLWHGSVIKSVVRCPIEIPQCVIYRSSFGHTWSTHLPQTDSALLDMNVSMTYKATIMSISLSHFPDKHLFLSHTRPSFTFCKNITVSLPYMKYAFASYTFVKFMFISTRFPANKRTLSALMSGVIFNRCLFNSLHHNALHFFYSHHLTLQ